MILQLHDLQLLQLFQAERVCRDTQELSRSLFAKMQSLYVLEALQCMLELYLLIWLAYAKISMPLTVAHATLHGVLQELYRVPNRVSLSR